MEPMTGEVIAKPTLLQEAGLLEAGMRHVSAQIPNAFNEDIRPLDPCLQAVPLAELPYIIGGAEVKSVGVYIPVLGDVQGQIMVISSCDDVVALLDALQMRSDVLPGDLDAFDRLRLAEIAASLGTVFLEQVEQLTRRTAHLGEPIVMIDMAGSILDLAIVNLCERVELVHALAFSLMHLQQEHVFKMWLIPDLVNDVFG